MSKYSPYITFIVILAIALGNAGSTLYLPAVVNISKDLHVSSYMMKMTLSAFLISFGVSQLFYGPLSESFGRKKSLSIGLLLAVLGGLISGSADNVKLLIVGRLIEGVGYAAANAVGYAMLRDVFDGKELSKKISLVSVFIGTSSTLSLLIGGYVVVFIGWRYCFSILALLTLIAVLINVIKVPETNKSINKRAWYPSVAFKEYLFLFKSLRFMGAALSTGIAYGALLSLYAMLPFLIVQRMHFSPAIYGWMAVILGLSYVTGAFFSQRMVSKLSISTLFIIGACIVTLSSISGYLLSFEGLNTYLIIVPSAVITFGMGICVPMGSGACLSIFPERGGTSSALLGTIQFIAASALTGLCGSIPDLVQGPMFLFIGGLGIGALLFKLMPTYLCGKAKVS